MFGGDSSYLSHTLYVMVGSIRYTEYYEVVSLRHFSNLIYMWSRQNRDAVGISRRGTNHNSDLKEKVEMDRSHPKETG